MSALAGELAQQVGIACDNFPRCRRNCLCAPPEVNIRPVGIGSAARCGNSPISPPTTTTGAKSPHWFQVTHAALKLFHATAAVITLSAAYISHAVPGFLPAFSRLRCAVDQACVRHGGFSFGSLPRRWKSVPTPCGVGCILPPLSQVDISRICSCVFRRTVVSNFGH